jgi:hypothetical protein
MLLVAMIDKTWRRAVTSFGASVWLSSMLSCANAPAPTAAARSAPTEEAQEYYPLQTGWKWAYDVERGGERILAVTAVQERRPNAALLQAGGETLRYDIGPAGIARAALPGLESAKRATSTDFLIKNPVRPGNSWPIEGGTATITGVGRSVTVAAGTFDNCVVVEEARSGPPRLVRTTYAPGVGPVALESLVQVPGRGSYETTLRASLRGVTRPGEDPLQ